ncbi:UNVERIFIED_CONTAM: hypothetical protein GTU68_046186, partial [Idotea baltica]|nr:hypothetical protein [Idotea baltica]
VKYSDSVNRLFLPTGDKWAAHKRARALVLEGKDIIELSLGGADIPTPQTLVDDLCNAIKNGRTGYTDGAGEPELRAALAARYSRTTGRDIGPDQILCFPGTQTSLYAVMNAIGSPGDEIIVGDPMYATYESVIASSGAAMVSVPLRAENDFRMSAKDVEAMVTDKTTAIFINTPHNPTGSILTEQDIREIGEVAIKHDLWIVSDEVYEEMIFEG